MFSLSGINGVFIAGGVLMVVAAGLIALRVQVPGHAGAAGVALHV